MNFGHSEFSSSSATKRGLQSCSHSAKGCEPWNWDNPGVKWSTLIPITLVGPLNFLAWILLKHKHSITAADAYLLNAVFHSELAWCIMSTGKAYQRFNWFLSQSNVCNYCIEYRQALNYNYILILFGNFLVKFELSLGHILCPLLWNLYLSKAL